MSDVGIKLTMTENVSAVGPKVSDALRNVASVGDDLREALDLGDLEEKYRHFAERVDRLYDLQRANREQAADEERQQKQRTERVQKLTEAPVTFLRGTGGVIQRAAGGDIAGAGFSLMDTLAGMAKSMLNPAAILVGGLIGIGVGLNKLVEQYERIIPTIMDTAAALGELGDTSKESSEGLKRTFDEVSASAEKFGYTFEEGAEIVAAMARAGAVPTIEQRENVMAYARAYAVPPNVLAQFRGLGGRFGMPGNLLGAAAGALQAAGMNEARMEEFLTSTQAIFEEGLSRGVVRGFRDIMRTQVWLAGGGEIFRGQTGLAVLQQLNQVAAGGVALQSERDVILFRAARAVMERMTPEQRAEYAPGYAGIMQYMEAGMRPEYFEEIRRMVREMTPSVVEELEQMVHILNMSWTTVAQMLGLPGGPEKIEEREAFEVTETEELKALRAGVGIQKDMREWGREYLPTKVTIMESAAAIVEGLKNFFISYYPGARDISRAEELGFPAALPGRRVADIPMSERLLEESYLSTEAMQKAVENLPEGIAEGIIEAFERTKLPAFAEKMMNAADILNEASGDLKDAASDLRKSSEEEVYIETHPVAEEFE